MDKYYWPIAFAFMGFLFGNMGGSSKELLALMALGGLIGTAFSILLVKLGERPRAKFTLNVGIGLVWAFLVFAVAFPSLRRPSEGLETSAVVYLAIFSCAPMIVFLLFKAIGVFRSKTGSRINV